MKRFNVRVLAAGFAMALFISSASQGQVIYDSTVSPLPGNLPSVGAEAYAFEEIGDAIDFAGTVRRAKNATVTMSSWGCQTGNWYSHTCVSTPGATYSIPVTLNIYAAGSPTPGALLGTKTQTFAIPYRPSSDPSCTGGRWKQVSTGDCFNGLASNITFDLTSLNLTLPSSVVYGVTYDTSHYGPNPIGESPACYTTSAGCFYDSLNVALAPVLTVGSKPFPDTLYWNNSYASNYCDNGLAGPGIFRLDSPTVACWAGYIPAAQFQAYTIATSGTGCKNDGWRSLSRADGSAFKNQGDCIQYVNTGK